MPHSKITYASRLPRKGMRGVPLADHLREQLREHRLGKDITYRELAVLIGATTLTTIQRAERGARLDERTIRKIERFLEGLRAS